MLIQLESKPLVAPWTFPVSPFRGSSPFPIIHAPIQIRIATHADSKARAASRSVTEPSKAGNETGGSAGAACNPVTRKAGVLAPPVAARFASGHTLACIVCKNRAAALPTCGESLSRSSPPDGTSCRSCQPPQKKVGESRFQNSPPYAAWTGEGVSSKLAYSFVLDWSPVQHFTGRLFHFQIVVKNFFRIIYCVRGTTRGSRLGCSGAVLGGNDRGPVGIRFELHRKVWVNFWTLVGNQSLPRVEGSPAPAPYWNPRSILLRRPTRGSENGGSY